MMGRQRLDELERNGGELVADGHREGSEILELVVELRRLRSREWTAERLHDALDTLMAFYLSEPAGRQKGLGSTSLLEFMEWSGARLRASVKS